MAIRFWHVRPSPHSLEVTILVLCFAVFCFVLYTAGYEAGLNEGEHRCSMRESSCD